jgi:hypothetical protein
MSKEAKPNELRAGDYYAVCDECARRFWASTMKVRWDGAFVDDDCWEPQNEGDKSKVVREKRNVPISRDRVFKAGDNELAVTPSNTANWYGYEE